MQAKVDLLLIRSSYCMNYIILYYTSMKYCDMIGQLKGVYFTYTSVNFTYTPVKFTPVIFCSYRPSVVATFSIIDISVHDSVLRARVMHASAVAEYR